jgi:hypothetical protein
MGLEKERSSMGSIGRPSKGKANAGTKGNKDRYALSDGDVEEVAQDRERTEGKSTEEESEAVSAFGGIGLGRPWSGKVQKKIELWAGYAHLIVSSYYI